MPVKTPAPWYMNRYVLSLLFAIATLPLALVDAKLPFVIGSFVVAFVVALIQPVWTFLLRPLAYYAGMVKPNVYDWQVIAWKEERAGRWEEAMTAYNNALSLEPGNQIVRAKRDLLIERLKQADPYYPFPPDEDFNQ